MHTANIVKGVQDSPSYISEKDRFSPIRNQTNDYRKSEQQIFKNKKFDEVDRRFSNRKQIQLNSLSRDINLVES